MELNYVLAWVVGISSGASLLAHAVRYRFRFRGWVGVFGGVLAVLAIGAALVPAHAGYLASAVWLVAFLLPALLGRRLQRLMMRQRYVAARRLARLLAVLHPFDGWTRQPAFIDALAQIQRGDLDGARRRVDELDGGDEALARFVRLNLMRAEGDWVGIRAAIEDNPESGWLLRDSQTATLYVRALGETGNVNEMLSTYGRIARTPIGIASRQTLRLYVAALGGRPDIVAKLFATGLRDAAPPVRGYWIATAEQVAGRGEEALDALQRLAQSDDFALRGGARYRLQWPVSTSEVSDENRALLDAMAREVEQEQQYGLAATPRSRATPVTLALIAVNLGVFALEVPGGSEDPENLVRLGALVVPLELVGGEWWRVFTAGFLHFGVLHLLLNVAGIWVLGRYTERVWGRWTLLSCYLAATFGANTIALFVLQLVSKDPAVAVGASGGVMGILGAALAFASIEWRRTRAPLLRRHVSIFAGILVLQVVFDLATPKVSSTIHMSGLGIGVLLGLALALRFRRAPADAGHRGASQPSGPITSAPK